MVGGALPNQLTGRSWVAERGEGSPEASRTVRLANKSLPSSGAQSGMVLVVGWGWGSGGGGGSD